MNIYEPHEISLKALDLKAQIAEDPSSMGMENFNTGPSEPHVNSVYTSVLVFDLFKWWKE